MNIRFKGYLLIALLVSIPILIYVPALPGDFLHDDFVNIVDNKNVHITDFSLDSLKGSFVSINTGLYNLQNRPVSRFTFSLNYYFAGLDPFWFKLTNLVLHILFGFIIFQFVKKLLYAHSLSKGDNKEIHINRLHTNIALLTAFIWLIHPLNVSTVMYVVQRMTQLSALLMMLAFVLYLKCRINQLEGKCGHKYLWPALFLVWPLAVFAKENAIIFPYLCLITEVFLLRFKGVSPLLKGLYGLVLLLTLLLFFYLFYSSYIEATYGHRDFSLIERLFTELRVFWMYIASILIPSTGEMGLYLDYFPVSRGLFDPITTLYSLIGLLLLVSVAIIIRQRLPVVSFGVFWFLTGHIVESTFLGLELAYEHRNYFPAIGIILSATVLFALMLQKYAKLRRIMAIGLGAFILLLALLTFTRSMQWSSEFRLVSAEAEHHKGSYRANAELARMFISIGEYDLAREAAGLALKSTRPYANIYFALLSLENIQKKTVSEKFYSQVLEGFKSKPIFVSILNQFTRYIQDAARNGWEGSGKLLLMAEALQSNPSLQTNYDQANLHIIFAKLYSDLGEKENVVKHVKKAYQLLPTHVSSAKLYAHILISEGKKAEAKSVITSILESTSMASERKDFLDLYEKASGEKYLDK